MSQRTRVKICGITRAEHAATVCECGADAIGLVFYSGSPRNISIEQAREICNSVTAFTTVVALFMDAEREFVQQVVNQVPLDLLQFHGNETVKYCESFSLPYIKAVGMQGQTDPVSYMEQYASARGFLLDSHTLGQAGGTGETFDWQQIPQQLRSEIILAGGLNPDNVADAIRQVRPFAIDISSGVESSPGIKDSRLIQQLMNNVKRVDCEHE